MSKRKQAVEEVNEYVALAEADDAVAAQIAALDARRATGGMGIDEYTNECARIRFEATQPKPVVLPKADPDYTPPEDTTPQDIVVRDAEPLPGE